MKKLGFLALVLGLVLAFALPAMSFTIEGAKGERMYLGGIFMFDMGYFSRSKEYTGTGTDNTQFVTAVPIHSRLRGFLEIGNVGGYWEFGIGGQMPNTAGELPSFGGPSGNNYVETRRLYGYYKFGNCELRTGKDFGYYGLTVRASQYFGYHFDAHGVLYGWGNVNDYRDPQIRFTQNVNKQFGYMITLLQPYVWNEGSVTSTDPRRVSYSQIPRVALKMMIETGMFSLYPAFQWQTSKFDNLNQTAAWAGKSPDDTISSWQVLMPLVFRAGQFKASAQYYYGQNSYPMYGAWAGPFHSLGVSSAVPANAPIAAATPPRDASGAIKPTTDQGGFIDLAYTIGPFTPAIFFGYDNAKNSDIFKGPKGVDNNTRLAYGASCSIKIADGFYVVPEVAYYNQGEYPAGMGAKSGQDYGKIWLAGVEFQFIF
jgi:hypothetical protein